MDGERFDAISRALARQTSRRGVARGGLTVGLGALAAIVGRSAATALAANAACAAFCRQLPPGPARGRCTSDAAHGQGVCYECGPGNPTANQQLCGETCVDTNVSTDHCGGCDQPCPDGKPCVNGVCGCPDYYAFCPHDGGSCVRDQCVINPGYRVVFSPETCDCVCQPGYVTLPSGNWGCGIPCEQDGECGEYNVCGTTSSGLRVCRDAGYLPYCTPCETDSDCYDRCHAVNTFCEDHVCRGAI